MSASSKEAVATALAQSQEPLEAILMLSQDTGLADHEAVDYLRQFFQWIMKSARRRREFKAAAGEVTKLFEGEKATPDQVLVSMDFLRKHYEKPATEYATSNPVLAAAICTSRSALDKWQAINSYTPAYAAALLLHPTYPEAYINKQWPPSWRTPAITAASLRHTSLVHIPEFVRFTKSMPVLIDDAVQWWLESTQQLNYPNLCLEEVDLPLDEGEEDGKKNQKDQKDKEGQGVTLEGQGDGDDDDGK
ncbi:hypothetical protein D6C98_09461 [Aureobasidium pullulans]|nr:hypothetical protein D6C98_09461 [Aureobasidium pullulans]